MFHPALLKLIRLQWRGGFRRFLRSLRTLRGLFQLAFILAMLGQFAFSMYVARTLTTHATNPFGAPFQVLIKDFLAVGLFAMTSYILIFSTGDAAVYFTASEVAFLFPAPVTRKQLLSYKLLASLIGSAAISLVFTLLSMPPISMALPRFIAVVATFLFVQLLAMNVAFARQVLQEKLHVLIRRTVGFVVACLLLIAVSQTTMLVAPGDWGGYLKAFHESTIGTVLLAPFQVFVRAIQASDWPTFSFNAAIILVVDFVLLNLGYRMDALSLEAAFAFSEKTAAKIKRMQTKGVWQDLAMTNSAAARRRVPMLPFWAGIGPVLWQRVSTTIRSSPKLLLIPVIAIAVAGAVTYQQAHSKNGAVTAPLFGVGVLIYASFLISLTMQNDIDRIGYLKSLPVSSRSIVIGDLIGFPILLSFIQSLYLIGLATFFTDHSTWFFAGIFLTPFLNFLLFGVDKLIFYIYPTRMAKGAPGDFQASGKQMIFMTLKMLILGGAATIVALAALPGALLFASPLVACASSGIVLAIECVILVPLLTAAFDRFDPGSAQIG